MRACRRGVWKGNHNLADRKKERWEKIQQTYGLVTTADGYATKSVRPVIELDYEGKCEERIRDGMLATCLAQATERGRKRRCVNICLFYDGRVLTKKSSQVEACMSVMTVDNPSLMYAPKSLCTVAIWGGGDDKAAVQANMAVLKPSMEALARDGIWYRQRDNGRATARVSLGAFEAWKQFVLTNLRTGLVLGRRQEGSDEVLTLPTPPPLLRLGVSSTLAMLLYTDQLCCILY